MEEKDDNHCNKNDQLPKNQEEHQAISQQENVQNDPLTETKKGFKAKDGFETEKEELAVEDSLTVDESEEAMCVADEEEPVTQRQNKINKWIISGLIALLLICLCIVFVLFYPFTYKLVGNWHSTNVDGLTVSIKDQQAIVKSGTTSEMIVYYIGDLRSEGVNAYNLTDVKIQLEFDKTKMNSEDIDKLKKNEEQSYTIITDSEEIFLLEYTEKVTKNLFSSYNQKKLFTIKLPMVYLPFRDQEMIINSQYMYADLIRLEKNEATND